jgi:hypothetical protein
MRPCGDENEDILYAYPGLVQGLQNGGGGEYDWGPGGSHR